MRDNRCCHEWGSEPEMKNAGPVDLGKVCSEFSS